MVGSAGSGTLVCMRSVLCDDATFAQLIGDGGLYDYELGERYIVAPGQAGPHGFTQVAVAAVLVRHFAKVSGPTNLGVLGEPGQRWYIVPELVVLPDDAPISVDAHLRVVLAVEVRSPSENPEIRLAHYREVMARTGLEINEVWYLDAGAVVVHPAAAERPGPTGYPVALAAVVAVLR